MSAPIREVINSEERIQLINDALMLYINTAKGRANAKLRGYGRISEETKKEAWAKKAVEAEQLLSDIMIELT